MSIGLYMNGPVAGIISTGGKNSLPLQFIRFLDECGAIRFEEITLNSGRKSPYYIDTGKCETGIPYDGLFGPAYKGIPIAVSTAIALGNMGFESKYAFNRKVEKEHGDRGSLVGVLGDENFIVDNVSTTGETILAALQFIEDNNSKAAGVVVAFDRQELVNDKESIAGFLKRTEGISIFSIANFDDLVEYLTIREDRKRELALLRSYNIQYGVKSL
jgi:orotate phosphoribosyltransferase